MRMVRSVLLGSAAGLVAVTAGQAADLPVKAQPVQYVKICTLYGAGFYYMPGTDMCLKIGGWVRAEITSGNGTASMTWGPFNANAGNRTTNNVVDRARGYITADVREQTAYGVARGYIAVGLNTNDTGSNVGTNAPPVLSYANRGYVQWAGFTAGLAQSFYDFYSQPAAQYRGGYTPASDTSDGGWWVWGYTAQFGGGFSASLSAETRREMQICEISGVGVGGCTITPGSFAGTTTAAGSAGLPAAIVSGVPVSGSGTLFPGWGAAGGAQAPDIVANVRLDQVWGSAQVMAAAHEVNASYYALSNALGSAPEEPGGHPSDQWGWAAGVGLKINFPMIAPGDYFQSQFNYTQGATRYLFQTPATNWGKVDGASESWGVLTDCVYGGTVAVGNTIGCQLTTAWGFNASYEHYWTPNWHQSVFGSYYAVNYDATANANLCAVEGNANGAFGSASALVTGVPCSNNWSTWAVGSRLQWDVTKSFYIGVEALYEVLDSAKSGCATIAACGTPISSVAIAGSEATLSESSSSAWAFTARVHKDFLP
jgi:hypothetical protein